MGFNEDLLAVSNGPLDDRNRVLELIRQGADVNTKNSNGTTPLHLAAGKGHHDICKILLEHGAGMYGLDNNRWSPLTQAIYNDRENVVRILLQKGADPNFETATHGTQLDIALGRSNDGIIKLLIEQGADVNYVSTNKQTPLYWACVKRSKYLVQLLLHKGASMETVYNPVAYSKKCGHNEIVDIFEKDYLVWLRLYHAALQGNYNECQALLGKNGLVDSSQYGLYCPIAAASDEGHYRIVQLLLNKGPITNNEDNNKRNPLYLATKKGHKEIASLLMDNGASPHIKINGDTLLHVATRNNKEDMVRLLTRRDVNPNIKNKDGWAPLHYAVINGNEAIISCLIKHSANANLATTKMETPLHLACEAGQQQIVQILRKNGANRKVLNNQKESPMDSVNRFLAETELVTAKNLEIVGTIKELLQSRKSDKPTRTENGTTNEQRVGIECLLAARNGASGQDSDSDSTVEYSRTTVDPFNDDLTGRILETMDIEELNTNIARLSALILEINDKAMNLELSETDFTLESDILTNLKRKIKNNRLLKRLKAGDSQAESVYEDAFQDLTRQLDETRQKEAKMVDEVKILKTAIKLLKTEAKIVYREIARFIN